MSESTYCPCCRGSGEGRYSGSTCPYCHGSGEVLCDEDGVTVDEDDTEEEDGEEEVWTPLT